MGEYTPIRNLKPGMKDLTLMFIALEVGRPNQTKDGHEVRTVKVADKTGSVNLSLWGEPGKHLQSGDIVRMTKGYINVWKGCLTLYVGKSGEFYKLGEFCLLFSETPFMSEYSAELAAVGPSAGPGGAPAGGGGPGANQPPKGQQQNFARNNGGQNQPQTGQNQRFPSNGSQGGRQQMGRGKQDKMR